MNDVRGATSMVPGTSYPLGKGVGRLLGGGVGPDQQGREPFVPGGSTSARADGPVPKSTPYSFLPWTAEGILVDVARFSMLATSQLRRLHYRSGTAKGRLVRCSKHLKRLTDVGLVKRIHGVYDGPPEYIYLPTSSKARRADMHTLDITELYVRLKTQHSAFGVDSQAGFVFDPEPWCHRTIGHIALKPDALLPSVIGATT